VYWKGHYGVSLLVFAPIAFALLAVGRADLAVVTGGVMLWLATLPDIDHRLPLIPHRGPTHSLVFAALVGGIFAAVGAVLEVAGGGTAWSIAGLSLPVVGFAIGALAILAHLLGDALTPAGVNFLWPVSTRTYTIGLCRADNTIANYGLFAAGVFATGVAVYLSVTL
jgi:inner membrane protein